MIVCKNCGQQNEDGADFCGNCGKFLEWHGERVAVAEPAPAPPPPTPAPPPPEPAHVGFMDRVKQAVGIEDTPSQPTETAPATPTQQQPPAAATASTASASAPAAAPYATPSASSPVRQVPVSSAPAAPASPPAAAPYQPAVQSAPERQPVLAGVGAPAAPAAPIAAPPAPEPESQKPTYQPQSQKPTYAVPKPTRPARTVAPPTRKAGPDDVYCGQCGEVNDKERHFCRRCGASLDEAIAVQLPWYRRLWNRLFHRRYEAGYRHRRIGPPNVMGAFWRVVRLAIGALILIFLLAFALIPSFRTGVINRVTQTVNPLRVQFFPRYDPIHATGASASTSIAGHTPMLTIDTFTGTYWAASPTDAHPVLTLTFPSPVDLADIGITSGASGTAPSDQFLAQPRPHLVHLVFSDGTSQDVTLSDQAKTQFYTLTNAKHVTSVVLQIVSTYPTSGPAPSSVAIDEVEFKVKD